MQTNGLCVNYMEFANHSGWQLLICRLLLVVSHTGSAFALTSSGVMLKTPNRKKGVFCVLFYLTRQAEMSVINE